MNKEKVSGGYLMKMGTKELFQSYVVLSIFYILWFVACIVVYHFFRLIFSDQTSLVIFRMLTSIPAGIFYVMPLVMMWDVIRFACKNKSEVITAPELVICAFDYGIDCVDETMIKNKSFNEIKKEFKEAEPFMIKRMKRNFLCSMILGMAVIIAIYKV